MGPSPGRRALIRLAAAGGLSVFGVCPSEAQSSETDKQTPNQTLTESSVWLAAPPARADHAPAGNRPPPAFFSTYGQFIQIQPRQPVPRGPISGGNGPAIDFSAMAGKVVVLNFWATWCAPCIHELPSLDRLAARPDGLPLAVVPIALDAPDQASVATFFHSHAIRHLPVHIDPRRRIGRLGRGGGWHHPFPLTALPTTYLIDPRGLVAGYVPGAADWDSAAARALIAWVAHDG